MGRCVRIDLERNGGGEDRLDLHQRVGSDQQVTAVLLHHAEFTRIEGLQLFGGDMDALDLAAVLEVADMVGIDRIERLSGQEFDQLRLGFATQEEAVAYAEKNGFEVEVVPTPVRTLKIQAYADNFR